jgi:hypothetical protein
MATLIEMLLADDKRPAVIRDCERVIEDEVASKRGVSGLAIKAGFKTVKAFKRTIVPDVMDFLLPDFAAKIEPFHQKHVEAGGGDFAAYCVRNGSAIADALLEITDARARGSRHTTLVKAYNKLRPMAQKQVVEAMPRIGAMLVRNGA